MINHYVFWLSAIGGVLEFAGILFVWFEWRQANREQEVRTDPKAKAKAQVGVADPEEEWTKLRTNRLVLQRFGFPMILLGVVFVTAAGMLSAFVH